MKRKRKIICAAITVGLMGSVWAVRDHSYTYGYVEGRFQAWQEVRQDSMTLYVYGDLSPQMSKGGPSSLGVPCKAIAGCMVNRRQVGQHRGHNSLIEKHLEAKTNNP